ncbi:hypothetical protein T484DRAFT_1815150, partial [Baffinella frigidus]
MTFASQTRTAELEADLLGWHNGGARTAELEEELLDWYKGAEVRGLLAAERQAQDDA